MQSLVPDFIINPVLRQARRFSDNFAASEPEPPAPDTLDPERPRSEQNGISGMDDDVMGMGETVMARSGAAATPTEAAAARSMLTFPGRFRMASEQLGTLTITDHDAPHDSPQADSHLRPPLSAAGEGGSRPLPIERLNRSLEQTTTPSSLPTSFYGRPELPEDDGMSTLRRRLIDIQSRTILPSEKALLMHGLLMEGYTKSQIARQTRFPARPVTPSNPAIYATPAAPGPLDSFKFWQGALGETPIVQKFVLTEEDVQPTFVPTRDALEGDDLGGTRFLGCEHYRRNVKMQCSTCERWYTCRLCHNEAEDHVLPRRETRNMLCMLCGHAQRVGDICVGCGESAARYYCNICKLWNDDPTKSIYHCSDCGICRVGEGLGKDFVHCKKCGSCIAITMEDSHKCREGAMDCDCPICGDYMFTSHKKVVSMKCGHMIHEKCRSEYIKTSYKCPICSKSVENMESQFRRLDKHLEEQPMPPEYENTRALVLCNDCEAKTSTMYHWGGLKCQVCLSYNTVELRILNPPPGPELGGAQGETTRGVSEIGVSTTSSQAESAARASLIVANGPATPLVSREGSRDSGAAVVPAQVALPVSPAYLQPVSDHDMIVDDSDGEEDMLDFWGERRSMKSTEDDDPEDSEGDDEDVESGPGEDIDGEEEEDEEEEEIALFGHR